MSRDVSNDIIAQKNKIAGGQAWFWLAALQANDSQTYYFCQNNSSVTFRGNDYRPFAFSIEEFNESGRDEPPRVRVALNNAGGLFSRIIEENNGFTDGLITLTLYNPAGATDDDREIAYGDFRIQQATVNNQTAGFEVGNDDLFRFFFPRRRFFRNKCTHIYKGTLCGYTGELASCSKTLTGDNGCMAHFEGQELPYGGYPGLLRAS